MPAGSCEFDTSHLLYELVRSPANSTCTVPAVDKPPMKSSENICKWNAYEEVRVITTIPTQSYQYATPAASVNNPYDRMVAADVNISFEIDDRQ